MKNLKALLMLLSVIIFVYSCTNENLDEINNEKATLKFIQNTENTLAKEKNSKEYLEIDAEVISRKPFKLKSKYLKEVQAINKKTGEETYGYILVENNKKENANFQSKASPAGEIRHGYFLYGRCFVYGTMYIGDNGVNLFVPCGINCIALDPICPGENEAFV
ncbi:MAG: hypothetical protein ACWIPI_09855 [Polaribacter sp.]